jgi:hypothetical protein
MKTTELTEEAGLTPAIEIDVYSFTKHLNHISCGRYVVVSSIDHLRFTCYVIAVATIQLTIEWYDEASTSNVDR